MKNKFLRKSVGVLLGLTLAIGIPLTAGAAGTAADGSAETAAAKIAEEVLVGDALSSTLINTNDQVTAFVERMYTKALNRDAEDAGRTYWVKKLTSHKLAGAGIAKGFIGSDEFTRRNLSDTDYVDTLYRTFFDREPDTDGRNYWVNQLSAGVARSFVLSGFVNSQEFSNLCDQYGIARGTMKEDGSSVYNQGVREFVERIYTKALNRTGETMGIEDWSYQILTGTRSAEDVAKLFFASEEFLNRNLSNSDYVETLYQTFMGRASDETGKADWVGKLDAGTYTRDQVLEGFSKSAEFANIMASYGLGEAAADDAIANLIAATEGTVELELWCSETDAYQTVMAELVEGFKETYSDVDFNITIGAVSEADAKDRVLEDVEAAADVFVFPDDQILALVTAGALQAVATTFTYDPNETNSAGTVAAATVDGQLYAYPLTASNGYFLYYNSDVLTEEDCASWESLVAAAEAAGKQVGMDLGSGWYLYGFFAGAGCTLTMNDDGSNTCDWNSETGLAVAESIMNIASSSAFLSVSDMDAMSMLSDGNLVAYVSGTWDSGTVKSAYGTGYAAAKLPTFDVYGTATQMGSYAGYKFVGVNAYSEQSEWAKMLAEYLTSEESQAAIAAATGEGPANTVAASTISSPALSALAEQSEYADQQVVGRNFWTPAASLGASLAEGADDLQALLDEAVTGITQAVE